ncbi:hypothetical protein BC829DRAFT_407829 [Chytridium lagenaria]|nr:hypothetical protein BC829DRAFT_407829 [Chytridium lagenaria]
MATASASSVYRSMLLVLIISMVAVATVRAQEASTCGRNEIISMDFDIVNNDRDYRVVDSRCECASFCESVSGCFVFAYVRSTRSCFIKRITPEPNYVTIFMSAPNIEIPGNLRSDISVGNNLANSKGECISRCQGSRTCKFVTIQEQSPRVGCYMYAGNIGTLGRVSIMAGTVQQPDVAIPPPPPPSPSTSPSNPPSNPPPGNSSPPAASSPSANQPPSDSSQQTDSSPLSTTDATDAVAATTIDVLTITDSTGAVVTTTRHVTLMAPVASHNASIVTASGISTDSALGISPTDTPKSGNSGSTTSEAGLSKGGVIGLAIGAIIVVAAVIFGVFFAVKRRKERKEGGQYHKWGDHGEHNPTNGGAGAGGRMGYENVKLSNMAGAGKTASLPSANTAAVISPAPVMVSTLERPVAAPAALSPESSFAPIPESTVVAAGAASSVAEPTRKYTKAYTVEQYLKSGWTMEQIETVKPPIAPSKKVAPAMAKPSVDTLARGNTHRTMHEPLESN